MQPIPKTIYAAELPTDEHALFQLTSYALLDITEGCRVSGSESLLKELLALFLNTLQQDIDKIVHAHEAQDWAQVQALAHKMKGGAVYIGTTRLKVACQYLERYWKIGQRACLEKLYQQVLRVLGDTREAVEAWLKNS